MVSYQGTALDLMPAGGHDFSSWETNSNTDEKYAEHFRRKQGEKKGKKALLGERRVHRSPNSEDLTEVCPMNFLLFLWYEFLA